MMRQHAYLLRLPQRLWLAILTRARSRGVSIRVIVLEALERLLRE